MSFQKKYFRGYPRRSAPSPLACTQTFKYTKYIGLACTQAKVYSIHRYVNNFCLTQQANTGFALQSETSDPKNSTARCVSHLGSCHLLGGKGGHNHINQSIKAERQLERQPRILSIYPYPALQSASPQWYLNQYLLSKCLCSQCVSSHG